MVNEKEAGISDGNMLTYSSTDSGASSSLLLFSTIWVGHFKSMATCLLTAVQAAIFLAIAAASSSARKKPAIGERLFSGKYLVTLRTEKYSRARMAQLAGCSQTWAT